MGSTDNSPGVNGAPSKWQGKQVFTTGEAAEVCNVSQQTIIRCFDSGRLNGFRVPGSRFRRIPRAELIKFMRANEIPLTPLDPGALRVLVVDDEPEILALFKDTFGVDDRGLWISVMAPFRFRHPALYIPWSEIETDMSHARRLKLTFPSAPGVTATMSRRVFEELAREAGTPIAWEATEA